MHIVFTIGDINGIGLEALIKALSANNHIFSTHTFSITGNSKIIEEYIKKCSLNCHVESDKLIINQHVSLDIIDSYGDNYDIEFATISRQAGELALSSIDLAIELTIAHKSDAMVTLPVSKAAINLSQQNFIGHTEYIADVCCARSPIMILFTNKTRVALATTHIPLHRISTRITSKRLCKLIRNFNISLKQDFGCVAPKIAVLGLNPHSGENGILGKEEINKIIPSINIMKKKGVNVDGAFPADGFFAHKLYEEFDGIIAMYHDQGLIPLKMLAAGGGVNFTAGLSIVRTSPDHGTAFEIAGKNIANPQSTYDAIIAAIDIAEKRKL